MISYDYDADGNVIHCRPTGVITLDQIVAYFGDLTRDEELRDRATERVYFQDIADIALNYQETIKLRWEYAKLKAKKGIAETVFVTDSSLAYGMARMIQSVFTEIPHATTIEQQA